MKRISLLLLILIASTGRSEAVEYPGGALELSLNGSFKHYDTKNLDEEVGTGSTAVLGVRLGYFVGSVVQLAGLVEFARDTEDLVSDSASSWHSTALGALVIFNWPTESAVSPYMGVGAAMVLYGGDRYGEEIGTSAPRLIAGIRANITRRMSINTEFQYSHESNLGGWDELSSNIISLAVGFSAYFNEN